MTEFLLSNDLYPIRQDWFYYDRPLIWVTWKDGEENTSRRLIIAGDRDDEEFEGYEYLVCDMDLDAIKFCRSFSGARYPEYRAFFQDFLYNPRLVRETPEDEKYIIIGTFPDMFDPFVDKNFMPDYGGEKVDMSLSLDRVLGPEDEKDRFGNYRLLR